MSDNFVLPTAEPVSKESPDLNIPYEQLVLMVHILIKRVDNLEKEHST